MCHSESEAQRIFINNMFGKKTKSSTKSYNPETEYPVIRASICTGEKTAGIKDKVTGHIRDTRLIRDDRELNAFMREFSIPDKSLIKTEY